MAYNDIKNGTKWADETTENVDIGGKDSEYKESGKEGSTDQSFSDKLNWIKNSSNDGIKDSFGVSKEDVLEELAKAKNIEQRVNVFAKWADKYGLEAVLSRIPWLGDLGPALISTCYLFYQGRKIGLGRKEMLRIFGYQALDFIFGSIPLAGNIVDFFFKGNVYSAKVFSEHVEKLKKIAIEKGAKKEEIESLNRTEQETLNKMEEEIAKRRNGPK